MTNPYGEMHNFDALASVIESVAEVAVETLPVLARIVALHEAVKLNEGYSGRTVAMVLAEAAQFEKYLLKGAGK